MHALRPLPITLAVSALTFLAACGTGAVPADQLEKTVSTKLKEQVGAAPKSVECPSTGLKAEVGAKATCTLTAPNGDKVKVYLTATDVNGNNVNFKFKVGTEVEKAST